MIFLAKLGRLNLLQQAAEEVFVPSAVIAEIQEQRDLAADEVEIAASTWLCMRPAAPSDLLNLLQVELGAGEAETIALATELHADRVVLDDLDGRRWARKLGLQVVGTLGLLLAAKLRGDISSLRAEIESLLNEGFRVSEQLIAAVLVEAGEISAP